MTATREQSLVALFDDEVAHERSLAASTGDPGAVRRTLHDVLDRVAYAVVEPVGRQVVEMARQSLTPLDTVRTRQERPRAEPPRRPSLTGFLFGPDDPTPATTRARLEVWVERLVDSVRDTLEIGERLQRDATPPPPEVVIRPWAEDPALVRLLHDLLAAARRPDDFVKVRIADQLVGELLLEHGIEVVEDDDGTSSDFTRVPAAVDTPRTISPALRHHGVLLRAGEVHVPTPEAGESARPAPAPVVGNTTTGGTR